MRPEVWLGLKTICSFCIITGVLPEEWCNSVFFSIFKEITSRTSTCCLLSLFKDVVIHIDLECPLVQVILGHEGDCGIQIK